MTEVYRPLSGRQSQVQARCLPMVARATAGLDGLDVVFDSNAVTAGASKGYIVLPLMRTNGSNEEVVLIRGLTNHEVGHHKFTDFDVFFRMSTTDLIRSLGNILEDVRIESELVKCYPGTKRQLAESVEILRNRSERDFFCSPKSLDEDPHPGRVVASMLLHKLRAEVLGQNLDDFAADWSALARKIFGQRVRDLLLELGLKGCAASDTTGVMKMAHRIVRLLQETLEDEPPPEQNDPQPNQPDDQQQDQPDDAANGQQDDQQSGQDSGQPDDQQQSGQQGNQPPNGQQPGGNGAGLNQKNRQAIEDVLSATASDIGSAGQGLEEVLRNEKMFKPDPRSSNPNDAPMEVEVTVDLPEPTVVQPFQRSQIARRSTTEVGMQLETLLEAKKDSISIPSRHGKLNARSLVSVVTHNPYVFTRTEENDEINTAIRLYLDRSGSMDGARIDTARDAIVSLGDALDRQDVPFSVAAFDDYVYPVKEWDEGWKLFSNRLTVCSAHGGTAMGAAHLNGVSELMSRQEERRILMLATDGEPSNWEALAASVDEAMMMGIETRFVLVSPNANTETRFEHFLKGYYVGICRQPTELPKAILAALSDVF